MPVYWWPSSNESARIKVGDMLPVPRRGGGFVIEIVTFNGSGKRSWAALLSDEVVSAGPDGAPTVEPDVDWGGELIELPPGDYALVRLVDRPRTKGKGHRARRHRSR